MIGNQRKLVLITEHNDRGRSSKKIADICDGSSDADRQCSDVSQHLQQIQMTAQVPMQMLHLLEQRWKLFGHDLEVKVENRTDVFDMKYKRC